MKRTREKSPDTVLEEDPHSHSKVQYASRDELTRFMDLHFNPHKIVDLAPSTLEIGICTKDEETRVILGASHSHTPVNPFLQALCMIYPLKSLMNETRKNMVGVRHTTPMDPRSKVKEEDEECKDPCPFTIKMVKNPTKADTSRHPTDAFVMKLKILIAALAVGKNYVEQSLDKGLQNSARALFDSLNREYRKKIEMPLPFTKYERFKAWLKQFPLLVSRIVYMLRNPNPETNSLTKAISVQSDILNQGAGMTHIFITHNFLYEASVVALTQKRLEGEISGFLDAYDKMVGRYPDCYQYLGTCYPEELIPLQKNKFELLFLVAHHWFVRGDVGRSRQQLHFKTTTTFDKALLEMYLKPVDIRTGGGNQLKPEIARKNRMKVSGPPDITNILDMICQHLP